MKVIIAGSRVLPGVKDLIALVGQVVDASPFRGQVSEVVSGAARGVDMAGVFWARIQNIPVKEFPAKWAVFGRAAGHLRNGEMADYADALIAIWDGSSPGTLNMIDQADEREIPCYIHVVDDAPRHTMRCLK